MADVLGVSQGYLSSLEMGRARVPEWFLARLVEKLGLDSKERMALRQVVGRDDGGYWIKLGSKDGLEKWALVELFVGRVKGLTRDQVERISRVLEENCRPRN